jgi:hypothetical protein
VAQSARVDFHPTVLPIAGLVQCTTPLISLRPQTYGLAL